MKEPFLIFSIIRAGIGGKAGDNSKDVFDDATCTMLEMGVVISDELDGIDIQSAEGAFEVRGSDCYRV